MKTDADFSFFKYWVSTESNICSLVVWWPFLRCPPIKDNGEPTTWKMDLETCQRSVWGGKMCWAFCPSMQVMHYFYEGQGLLVPLHKKSVSSVVSRYYCHYLETKANKCTSASSPCCSTERTLAQAALQVLLFCFWINAIGLGKDNVGK